MPEGTIRFFNYRKDYGFIVGDDDQEFFIHISAFAPDSTKPQEGQRVAFEIQRSPRGFRAVNVALLDEFRKVPPFRHPPRPSGSRRGSRGNRSQNARRRWRFSQRDS